MLDQGQHEAFVDAWLERSAEGLPAELLVRLFEQAITALWTRTSTTLGDVTLGAIADRVVYNAAEKYPLFSAITVEHDSGMQCRDLRQRVSAAQRSELLSGIRFVLVEFLTVLGNLTAEILSQELHAELSKVAIDAKEGSRKSS